MRKISFAFLMPLMMAATTLLGTVRATAQITNRAFDRNSSSLGFALGFGRYDYFTGVTPLPTFMVTYDHALKVKAGPGTISVGGAIGFRAASYKYSSGDRATWTDFMIGARAAYHVTFTSNTKWDVYAGALVGFGISSYQNDYYSGLGIDDPYDHNNAYPIVGPFVGTSYRFGKRIGVYSELGYDISFFKIGLNVKL